MPLPDRPMRVTMVNKYYWPPHLGGVETVVRNLSEGLVEHAGAEVRAIVCNEGRERVEETIAGVDVVRLPRQFALSSAPIALSMAGELRAEARRPTPPDVINLHFPYPWGELSWLQAQPDVPTVLCYHSDIVRQKRMLAAYKPVPRARARPRRPHHHLEPQPARQLAVPRAARREGAASSTTACTSSDIAEPARRRAARAPSRSAPSTRGRKIVLFVGRLVYYKGADVLVRAMAERRRRPRASIGRGPLESELREIAVANGVADARHASSRRRTTTSSRPTTTPPTCSACRAWPTARRSASCRSRRTPPARRSSRPTCPRACPTPTSTASPGSPCRVGDARRAGGGAQPPARRRRAARAPRRAGAERALTQFTIPRMVDADARRLR